MRICEDGVYRDATPAEIAQVKQDVADAVREPTTDERLAALEAAMLEQIMGVTV